jgi:hypothetical protein
MEIKLTNRTFIIIIRLLNYLITTTNEHTILISHSRLNTLEMKPLITEQTTHPVYRN